MSDVSDKARNKTIIAGIAGNVMEWYDFAVYGYFAPIIGRQFFPSDDPTASLIAAFGVFAAGFLARPFGGIVFGHIGDKLGRKKALVISVAMMAIPTFMIGLLPGYTQWGAAAALVLVALRLLQGLSVGGEYTSSITFLVEHAKENNRGFMASWAIFGAIGGIMLGSAIGAATTSLMSEQAVNDWGWRIPFLLGIGIGGIGLYIRRHIQEPPPTLADELVTHSPVIIAFREQWRAMLTIAGINVVNAVGFYMIFIYLATWLRDRVHISAAQALDINTINMGVLLVLAPCFGALSDRIGRKPLMIAGTLGILFFAYPLFRLMHHESFTMILAGQCGFAVLISMVFGVYPATIAELLPSKVRVSAMSMGYNLVLGILGGTTPMIAVYLISRTHDDFAPAFYLMAAACVSLLVLLRMPETAKKPLQP